MDLFIAFINVLSFVLALIVGPFIVGTRNIGSWMFYLCVCTLLTPVLGIPIYIKLCR